MNSCKETNKELDKKVNDSEQWLSNGDCSICRRRTFCHKDCKARSKSIEKDVESTISNILMIRMFGGGK